MLAAGNSSRFGENKLLYPIDGKPMVMHAVERALSLKSRGLLDRVLLVTQYGRVAEIIENEFPAAIRGWESEAVKSASEKTPSAMNAPAKDTSAKSIPGDAVIGILQNAEPERGISLSLQIGLRQLLSEKPETVACMFGVCDQPYLREETMAELIRLYENSGKGMAALFQRGEWKGDAFDAATIGNPVIFSSKYFPELLELTGDRGGKKVLLRHAEDAALLEADEKELTDLDVRPEEEERTGPDTRPDEEFVPRFFVLQDRELAETPIEDVFPFLADGKRHVISLVGGGGKSTLMERLAEAFAARGKTVVKTTTTHILQPDGGEYLPVQKEGLEKLQKWLATGVPVTVGTPVRNAGKNGEVIRKLTALSPFLLASVIGIADITIIEADGAKRLPMKAPAEHEPVIHPATDIVIAVLGMNAMGQPLDEVCFRTELAREIVPDKETVTPEDFAALFLSEQGLRKGTEDRQYYCLINQCDDETRREIAAKVFLLLEEGGVTNAAASILRPQ